jgi:hypothetical protein
VSDEKKVVGLWGNDPPLPERTGDKLLAAVDKARKNLEERKFVAVGVVYIEPDGFVQANFAHDAGKQTHLVGGLAYLQFKISQDLDKETSEVGDNT